LKAELETRFTGVGGASPPLTKESDNNLIEKVKKLFKALAFSDSEVVYRYVLWLYRSGMLQPKTVENDYYLLTQPALSKKYPNSEEQIEQLTTAIYTKNKDYLS